MLRVQSLTFNLGVTLLLEHLSTPESGGKHEGRDETVLWKDKETIVLLRQDIWNYQARDSSRWTVILNGLSRSKCMACLCTVWWSTERLLRWNRQEWEGWGGHDCLQMEETQKTCWLCMSNCQATKTGLVYVQESVIPLKYTHFHGLILQDSSFFSCLQNGDTEALMQKYYQAVKSLMDSYVCAWCLAFLC